MKTRPGYNTIGPLICNLKRSLYDLKQTARALFERFVQVILESNFIQSKLDSSLFIKQWHQMLTFLLVYVDDILITTIIMTELEN